MNKKFTARILSMLMAMLMLVSMLPTSVFAAPASDIPANMLDNVYLDALEYTGYKVQAQKDDGTIFKKYSGGATAYLSKISYGLNKYGTETVAKSGTATGLAPDIAGFESSGLCCASYVSYVYYNYLPNLRALTPAAQLAHTICAPQRHTTLLRMRGSVPERHAASASARMRTATILFPARMSRLDLSSFSNTFRPGTSLMWHSMQDTIMGSTS